MIRSWPSFLLVVPSIVRFDLGMREEIRSVNIGMFTYTISANVQRPCSFCRSPKSSVQEAHFASFEAMRTILPDVIATLQIPVFSKPLTSISPSFPVCPNDCVHHHTALEVNSRAPPLPNQSLCLQNHVQRCSDKDQRHGKCPVWCPVLYEYLVALNSQTSLCRVSRV